MTKTSNQPIYQIYVNDLLVQAYFSEENICSIFIPLLKKLTAIQEEKNRRIIVFFAAPPGCGKTTLVTFLETLSKNVEGLTPVQSIGIDGFHYSNKYLRTHYLNNDASSTLLMDIKGSPDTFDVQKLKETLALSKTSDVYWPVYSRAQHDVSDEGIQIKEKILLLEGNYLLLNCYPWNTLQKYADYSIFIKSDLSQLRKRLIDRKIQGGLDRAAAERFYEMSDSKNVELVLRESLPADLTLRMDHNANFSLIT